MFLSLQTTENLILLNRQIYFVSSKIEFRINSIFNILFWYCFLFMVIISIRHLENGVNICLRFYIRYNIRNLPLFIALVVKVLSEKIFVIDRKQNVKQISYDGRECACLTISILFFSKTTHAMFNCFFMPNIRQQQLFIQVTAHFKCFCISASTIKFRRAFRGSRIQKMFIFKR